jgi:hypothetical protein
MLLNSLQDSRLARQVLGRPRIKRRGIPYRESIEYKIIQKKKELGMNPYAPKYQMFFMGDWVNISYERYCEIIKINITLPEHKRFLVQLI